VGSVQKRLSAELEFNIVLVISCEAQCFLSTTKLCYGSPWSRKLCYIPNFSQRS